MQEDRKKKEKRVISYLQKIQTLIVQVGNEFGQFSGRTLAKIRSEDGGFWWPRLLGGRAQDLEDLAQLFHLVLTGKEGLPKAELGKDAAAGPQVDWGRVREAHQHLGATVP